MGYRPDPGGVFASDTHRRVLGHVPDPGDPPMELHPLGHHISPDPKHGLGHVDELEVVLRELEADDYCVYGEGGWVMTDEGLEALRAPAPEDDGPVRPALIDGLEVNLGGSS